LITYSRAELKGSDHRPVFASFRADVRIIDGVKRAALSRLLLESMSSTAPDGKLDEQLVSLALPADFLALPAPSSDDQAWWDVPDHPDGIIPKNLRIPDRHSSNPFDSPVDSLLSSSPSSSDEELYTHAQSLQSPIIPVQAGRRPPPPPPPPPLRPRLNTSVDAPGSV